jgi:hypothetical protein
MERRAEHECGDDEWRGDGVDSTQPLLFSYVRGDPVEGVLRTRPAALRCGALTRQEPCVGEQHGGQWDEFLGEPHRRQGDRLQILLHGSLSWALLCDRLGELRRVLQYYGHAQIVFPCEVSEDRPFRTFGFAGDLLRRQARKATRFDEPLRGIQNPLTGGTRIQMGTSIEGAE